MKELLATFYCDKNQDLEDFLLNENKAISFEKRQITKTYLFVDIDTNKIIAYYTLSLNIFSTFNLSKSLVKKLDGIDKNRDYIASYLIAQLGKSSKCNKKIGKYILMDAIDTIKQAINIIGGRFLIIDAINSQRVIDFYVDNGFVAIDNINQKTENIRMYYPINFYKIV
jgi:hypothetical protein